MQNFKFAEKIGKEIKVKPAGTKVEKYNNEI